MKTNHIQGARAYVAGLLRVVHNANCVRLGNVLGVSHDYLSRVLKTSGGCVFALVSTVVLKTLEKFRDGVLIIDDTTINKSFAKVIEGCSWLWSSNDERVVFGYQVVVLIWSNGTLSLPLRWEFYKKEAVRDEQRTKIDIAVDLLVYAKETLQLSPQKILFDSFYAAERILRQCEEYDWKYVTKIKSNRTLDGKQAKRWQRNPYWEKTGMLSCKLKARVVRHGKRYFLTNDFDAPKKQIVAFYDARWSIEEVFRVLHSRLSLDECESRSRTAQENHTALVMGAYVVLAREKTRSEDRSCYRIHDDCLADTVYAAQLVENAFVAGDLRGA